MGRVDRVLAGGARALALAGLVVLSACAGSVAAPVAMPVATPDPAPAAPSRQMSPLGRLPASFEGGLPAASGTVRWQLDLLPGGRFQLRQTFVDRHYMRRFAAVLNHRKAGFGANGMAVWQVPEEDLEEVGPKMAAFQAVSHCYKRPTYPDWPYNIFTMVHARSKEACEEAIDAIAEDCGLTDPSRRAILYSTYEFKKIRLMYYTRDYKEWEAKALAGFLNA